MRREIPAIASLILAATLLFADILFAGFNLYIRDIATIYYPERAVLASILPAGEIPLWNPHLNGGQPLAANPAYEAFYPLQWLLAAGNFRNAFHLVLVLHFPLAAAGMYLLLRAVGARRVVAWFAGFSWAIGGAMLSMACLVPFLYSLAWLPWIALFFYRCVKRPSIATVAAAAIPLGVMLLIGDVSMILQAGGLVAAYGTCASIRRRSWRPLVLAIVVVILATLVGAVQIVPALDLQRDTGRAEPLPWNIAGAWSMPWYRPVEMIWPALFGSASPDAIFQWALVRLYPEEKWPWVLTLYPGLLAAILVITGFIARVRGALFTGIVALVGYLLAIGVLFRPLYAIGFRSLRYPEKFILTTLFVFTIFAGIVAEEAIRSAAVRRTLFMVAAAIAAISAALVVIVPAAFGRLWLIDDPDLVSRSRGGLLLTLAFALMIALLVRLERLDPRLRIAILLLIVVVDLGGRVQGWVPRITADFYTPPPVARTLSPNARIYNRATWERMHEPATRLPVGILPWFTRNSLTPQWEIACGFDGTLDFDVTGTNLRPSIEFARLFHSVEAQGRNDRLPLLMQMAGASDIAVAQPLDPAVVQDPRRFDEVAPVRILHFENAGPFYFAERLATDARSLLSNEALPPRTAFVSIPPFSPADGRVIRARRGPNSIDLDVDARGRSFLVLAVTPHKYWRAAIDGRPAELHAANVGFQGLFVETGRHRVALRYRNPLVAACAWISAITALLLLTAAVALRSRALPQPSPR